MNFKVGCYYERIVQFVGFPFDFENDDIDSRYPNEPIGRERITFEVGSIAKCISPRILMYTNGIYQADASSTSFKEINYTMEYDPNQEPEDDCL